MPPKKTPTETLAKRGSWRAKERGNEPKPPAPNALPAHTLSGRAAEVWEELGAKLLVSGLLTVADVPAFRRYCRITAAWERAMEDVETGQKLDRQAILTLAKLEEMLRKLDANFGLSPADRTSIAVAPETNDKSKFFARSA
jgi:phage terminase small subunit